MNTVIRTGLTSVCHGKESVLGGNAIKYRLSDSGDVMIWSTTNEML